MLQFSAAKVELMVYSNPGLSCVVTSSRVLFGDDSSS